MEDLDHSGDEEGYDEYNDQNYSDEEEKIDNDALTGEKDAPTYCMQGLEPLDFDIAVCDPTIKDGLTKYYIYSVKVRWKFL
jgi:hypothetical protein